MLRSTINFSDTMHPGPHSSLNHMRQEGFMFSMRYRMELLALKKMRDMVLGDLRAHVDVSLPPAMRGVRQYVRCDSC